VCGSTPLGHDPQQGFSKPIGFIKAESWDGDDEHRLSGKTLKMDEELEQEQKEARRCDEDNSFRDVRCIKCHGLVAATGYSNVHFPYRTTGSSFSSDDLTSSPLPIVVARYFFTLPVPSPSFLTLPFSSGTFRSRSSYVPLPSGSFCTLPTCSG